MRCSAADEAGTDKTPEGASRRRQVLAVSAQLFASKGSTETSLADIAQAADLKEASLYHYYTSKHAILLAVLTEGIDELMHNAAAAASIADPIERLDALLAAHARNFEQKLPHVVVFLLERRIIQREIGDTAEAQR